MSWSPEQYEKVVAKVHQEWYKEIFDAHHASQYSIPEEFLGALICKESSGDKQAVRNEPHILNQIVRLPVKTTARQRLEASSSWGACQIMGAHSREFKELGKVSAIGTCGTLDYDLIDFIERPCLVAVAFLFHNAMPYVLKKDWESVARIYNTGLPTPSKDGYIYVNGDPIAGKPSFLQFMKFYKIVLKVSVNELKKENTNV